jgi:hypothetical protein
MSIVNIMINNIMQKECVIIVIIKMDEQKNNGNLVIIMVDVEIIT